MTLKTVVTVILQLCIIYNAQGLAADVTIMCPANFKSNQTNTITCEINSVAIASAACAVPPNQVNFNFKKKDEQSSRSQCDASYPCTSISNPSSTNPCTCTEMTSGVFTYSFLFLADKTTHEGGDFTCTVCAGPVIDSQENCNSIKFGANSKFTKVKEAAATACTVFAQLGVVFDVTFSILYFVFSRFNWSFKCILLILVPIAVAVVILLSLALRFACEDFKDDCPCYTHCVVVIVFVVIDVVVGVITVGVVVKYNKREIDTSDGGAAASQKNPNVSNGTSLPTGSNRDK